MAADTVENALVLARIRVNDAIGAGTSGQTITDAQAFTLPLANAGWRRLQDILADYGCSEMKAEVVDIAVPPGFTTQATQQILNSVSTPALPADMISPLMLWERVSLIGGDFLQMDQMLNGLPGTSKRNLNQVWEWRKEQIVLPGATVGTDLRIRYMAYYPDFVSISSPIPITRCLNPLAWFICSEFCAGRGDSDTSYWDGMGEAGVARIWDRDSTQPKSILKPAEYGRMATPSTPQNGAGYQPPAPFSGGKQ